MIKVGFVLPGSGHIHRGIGYYAKNLVAALKRFPEVSVDVAESSEDFEDVDVIHYPFFDFFTRTLRINKTIPTVVTVHDVVPLMYPKYYPSGFRGKFNLIHQRQELKKVAAVVTDSRASFLDVEKYLNVPKDKIHSVYLGVDNQYHRIKDGSVLTKIAKKYSLPTEFAIYIGDVNWNKNLVKLTEAVLQTGLPLVCVGKAFERKTDLDHPELREYKEFLELWGEDPKVIRLGFVEDEDLVGILNLAKVLMLISRYEGFGLTVLSAQVCGVPVIAARTSALPEVAGTGAILVDPENVENITKEIKHLREDSKLRGRLIEDGFENVKRFSWSKTAKDMLVIYRKVGLS